MKDETVTLLEEGIEAYAKTLAMKAKNGELSAAEATHLRGMHRDSGGVLAFGGRPSSAGDAVLESMKDVDIEGLMN